MEPEKFIEICRDLAAIPFYPEPAARDAILRGIERFADLSDEKTEQRIRWLVDTAVAKMRQWGGVAELRGLWCSRWKPRDGIEEYCSLAGHRPMDSEMEPALIAPALAPIARMIEAAAEADTQIAVTVSAAPKPKPKMTEAELMALPRTPERTPEENKLLLEATELALKARPH